MKLFDFKWFLPALGDYFTFYDFGKDEAPPPPDYTKLAKDTQQSNIDMARMGLAANRVNQQTPFGGLSYSQTGTDQYGNPTYTATQTLSPEQQNIYNRQSGLTSDILGAAQGGMGNVYNSLMQGGVDQSKLAQTGINPGETYSDAIMRRLGPQIQQEKGQFDAQLANQGIAPGTEAYNNAKRDFDQRQNDKLTSAQVGGMQTGLAANQQGFNQAQQNLLNPINMVNSLRTGSNITPATYANAANMANVPGVDYMGAGQNQYNAQLAQTNANNAASGAFWKGLMDIGGAAMGAPPGTFSNMFGGGGGGGGGAYTRSIFS